MKLSDYTVEELERELEARNPINKIDHAQLKLTKAINLLMGSYYKDVIVAVGWLLECQCILQATRDLLSQPKDKGIDDFTKELETIIKGIRNAAYIDYDDQQYWADCLEALLEPDGRG